MSFAPAANIAVNDVAGSSASRRTPLDRRLGSALIGMRDGRHFRFLGFVRLADYVVERLGISSRTAQELMRVEEAISRLPLTAEAFESGGLTAGHVRLVTRAATPESEAYWVGAARRMGIRALAAVVSHRGDGDVDASENDASAEQIEIEAPVPIARLWRETIAFARRLLGWAAPAGECLEAVLAEFRSAEAIAGSGDEADVTARADLSGVGSTHPVEGVPGLEPLATRSAEKICLENARALDAELRRLVTERQRQEAVLAARLAAAGDARSHRFEGFASLEAYASERVGLSPRRLYYLLSLHRSLNRLPALREAFIDGRLTLKQTLFIGKVATPATAAAWIRRAEGITLRRLEDEIDFWSHLRETWSEVWELLAGGPLPDGLVLVPGRAPRLHASAPSVISDGTPVTAEALLRALESDAAATVPQRMCRIRMRVEPGVKTMWKATVARCRAAAGHDLMEWEVLLLAIDDFWKTWDNAETRRQRRENPTLERDGWRCTAPGCRSLGSGRLQEHHVVFRSEGGALRDPSNLTTLCVGHHLGLIHEAKMLCSGRAPDALRWEMGIERGVAPFLIFAGESRVGGAAGGL
ncbi:MAG: HNH endonuclease [Acidobacteria bacterium]|nr:HNH endonuclease [Acidobacteriota bacterium]